MHRRGDVVVDGVHPPGGGRKRADTLDPLLVRLRGCDIAIHGWPWLVLGEETAHDLHSFYILPAYAWSQLRQEAQRRAGNARSSHSRQGVSLQLAKPETGSSELYWAGSGRMSIKETDMASSPRSPDRLSVVPVTHDGDVPADPWLRINDHGVSGLPVAPGRPRSHGEPAAPAGPHRGGPYGGRLHRHVRAHLR